jgi:hypothetical protein
MEPRETRYARSGDVAIAYQAVGEGPFDVVFIPGFVSHVELGWSTPPFDVLWSRLACNARLIVFDKRGSGMSDRVAGAPTLETRMDDVRAVMDAVGSARAAIVGISEGARLLELPCRHLPIGEVLEPAAGQIQRFLTEVWDAGRWEEEESQRTLATVLFTDIVGSSERGDVNYAPTPAPCNSATGQTSACLNVRYAESTDGGKAWSSSIQVTDTPTNLNYEQFGGRLVPFFGDYITVAAVGNTVGATWTDQRKTVGAPDPSGDNDGADVAGDPEPGGTCTSSLTTCFDGTGGLDQNIYGATITPWSLRGRGRSRVTPGSAHFISRLGMSASQALGLRRQLALATLETGHPALVANTG